MGKKTKNAAKLVSAALLGYDARSVLVNGKRYIIEPPTIKRLAGAAYHLADIADAETIADILTKQKIEGAAKALSWFICGSDALSEELSQGTLKEVTEGLKEAYTLIGVQDFTMLSSLAKSVVDAIAKQRR